MHEHIQKPLAQFNAGVITKLELINSIRCTLEFECGRTNYKNLVEGLPHHIFVVIHNDVARAPRSEEEWDVFQMHRGIGIYDPLEPFEDSTIHNESMLADLKASYYRFVCAWREAFGSEEIDSDGD